MAASNSERVAKALDQLRLGLLPFIEREMKAVYKDRWQETAQACLREDRGSLKRKDGGPNWDIANLLAVMWDRWNDVFKNILGQAERSIVSELRDVRNRWAHQTPFSTDDAYRALDSVQRLLTAVSSEEANEVDRQKQELLRVRYEEQARKEKKKASVAGIEGQPASGLLPWRQIVTPHPDVASGRYLQAEFAADLAQVHRGEGADEYKNPRDFFQRTFITEGLRHLLVNALQRLSGNGGDPVIDLQTNFGGGKTHSELGLYHTFSGVPLDQLPGIEPLLQEAGIMQPPKAQRAVLVGTAISPGQTHKKPDGVVVHTLWGELAWQLLKKEGYALVADADKNGVNPGDSLRQVLKKASPCLILIDEWVAYVRQLFGVYGLPAGTFDANLTFAQTLTEMAKAVPGVLVVASLPSSDIEIGGEGGREALARLKNTFSRVESTWRPASAEEGFEIVRRRLFQPITDPRLFAARDGVVRAFSDMYHAQSQEYPSECKEGAYERRMQAAYPIHPELFDRLYTDWSSLDKFQRTRGVLRLMAAVIHTLWERQDSNLLILPASIPIDEPAVQFELTRYLDPTWVPVIEKDVDGASSLPLQLDRDNPNLGRYSACRRVSRTVYLGSAPTVNTAHRGLDDQHIKLGCAQPGESVATFGDGLRRLTDQATYLYVDGRRYWFSTQPSVSKVADERAEKINPDDVAEEIRRRLKEETKEAKARGDFARVHVSPATSGDVPDEREARLVILGPEHPHAAKDDSSPARKQTAALLDERGTSPRICRNALVFLAPDRTRLKDLDQAVRKYLAWKSIEEQHETLNLDAFQKNQAKTKRQSSDETVDARIPETFQWLLVPGQSDPKETDPKKAVEWQEIRLQGQDALAVRASKRLRNDMLLIVKYGAALLRTELDRIPLWRGEHVSLKQLADDFAQYLYLPRLKSPDVIADAVQDGLSMLTWAADAFAYADAYDAAKSRYQGLVAGQNKSISIDSGGLLVRPETATKQFEAEKPPEPDPVKPGDKPGDTKPPDDKTPDKGGKGKITPPPAKKLSRFHGAVVLDASRFMSAAGKVADEVIQHLNGLVGAEVELILEIQVKVPEGVPEHVVRTVTENCRTLKFKDHGFEEG